MAKRLFRSKSQKKHNFCGSCGSEMIDVSTTRIIGYDRETGEPISEIRGHKQCRNFGNGKSTDTHDLVPSNG